MLKLRNIYDSVVDINREIQILKDAEGNDYLRDHVIKFFGPDFTSPKVPEYRCLLFEYAEVILTKKINFKTIQ